MQVEQISVELLIPYARNARTHDDAQVAQIAASIKEFGFCNPVLIDENNGIIAGHGRLLAARKLGMELVPCIRLSHLSDIQRRAYIIADNKLALNSGWDAELLRLEIDSLSLDGFNVDLTGFNDAEIDALLGDSNANDNAPDSSTKEIDTDDYQMGCRCPRCGFEFDDKQA